MLSLLLLLAIKTCFALKQASGSWSLGFSSLAQSSMMQPGYLLSEFSCPIVLPAPSFLILSLVFEQVMRKNSAIAEMNPVSAISSSFSQPTFSSGYPREHTPQHKLYPARRSIGPSMLQTGTSNLKWRRDASAATNIIPSDVASSTDMDMIITAPVRSSRSLSYVRVAPPAIPGVADQAHKS